MNMYIIRCWTGRVLFDGKEFDSFEDAWGHVYEVDPIPSEKEEAHYYDDYYVEVVS